jgi:multiple antibiotic resistance protein
MVAENGFLAGMGSITAYVLTALLPLVNPIGCAPVFLSLTEGATHGERWTLARKVALDGFLLLMGTVVFGGLVIRFFGIQVAHVEVAGGLVIFYTAWEMLKGEASDDGDAARNTKKDFHAMAFFPLTLPITIGPGCLAVGIALGSRLGHQSLRGMIPAYAGAGVAILAVMASVWVSYGFAAVVLRRLGPTGTTVVTKLSAFVLMAIGVEILWDGLAELIKTLG